MKKRKFLLFFFFFLLSIYNILPQSYEKKYVTVIPGKEYEAGWLHRLFFGDHWRDLWTTPLKVEVLDLNNFGGGLTPIEKGGGYQTKSLRLKSKDGTIWKFRSINKDPKKVLPEELQESLVADILQDQISTSNPLAPLIVAPILDSLNILQAKPKVILMPDDEKLGEFREEFANLLGMIEIHPQEAEEGGPGFENADKVSGTYKLLEKIEEERDHKVNAKEYLKARLVDIFLGDWDRHTDQWRWAKYDVGDVNIWSPIPRDRDQAFSKYDGIFPAIASYLTPQLTNFGYSYPQVEDITWNGRYLDRRFLSELTKETWDSVTALVYNKLTDDLIEHAVKQLPKEFFEKAGEEIIAKLKSRRNKLKEFSDDYYEFINQVVDIYCTIKKDYVEIKRISNNETEVNIYKLDKDTGDKEEPLIYHKTFDNNLTEEIRIHLLDDDDKVVINGNVDESPLIRVIGGKGKDVVEDNSKVNGNFLYITPIPDAENKTIVYDDGKETKINYGPGTCWDNDEYPDPVKDEEKYEPGPRDRGSDWIYLPEAGYNSNDGVILGSGFILNSYNFRTEPIEYKIIFTAAYAFNPESYIFSFNGDFYSIVKGGLVNLDLYLTELSLTDYYGYGNETDFDEELYDDDYYQLNQQLLKIHPSLKFPLIKNVPGTLGISYDYSDISLRNDTLLSGFKSGKHGLDDFKLFGIHPSIEFDTRDVPANPYNGLYLKLSGAWYPEVFDENTSFVKGGFDIRSYFTANVLTDVTLALRGGGEKLFGTYPFFKAAFLGGGDNLRGYNRERFSGDASLFGQAELRFFLSELTLLIRGKFGLFGFAETGRVFTRHDNSKKWHPSYGGGIWLSYLDRLLNFNFAVASSEETYVLYFLSRFMF